VVSGRTQRPVRRSGDASVEATRDAARDRSTERRGLLPTRDAADAIGLAGVLRLQHDAGNNAVSSLIRRTVYAVKGGKWTRQGKKTGGNRYPHPRHLNLTGKLNEGDSYDRRTGILTKAAAKRPATSEHLLDYAAGSRKSYGKWYGKDRQKTSYSYLSGAEGGSEQGPHTFAFIGKRAMAEGSVRSRKTFDPSKIKRRSALVPSPGQNRALVRKHEEQTNTPIPRSRKRNLDEAYKGLYDRSVEPKSKKARTTMVELMELGALGTYALGRKATDAEIKGKGEKRELAVEDLKLLAGLPKGAPMPAGLNVFDPNIVGHDPKHIAQLGRAIGRVAAGDEEDLSDLDIDSDPEYSTDDEGVPPADDPEVLPDADVEVLRDLDPEVLPEDDDV
jgi:hypothetical protein